MIQRVRAPLLGLTFLVTAVAGGWQSQRLYKSRQASLLADFGATMVSRLGDEREMATAIKVFRTQLGPGSYAGPMFKEVVKRLAVDSPTDVSTILELKRVVALMRLSQTVVASTLAEAAEGLASTPSALGKLVFVAERAVPAAATEAGLRTKFPTWSPDVVATLQRAMLENLYRDMCEQPGSDSPETLQILGLTEGEASRLREDVKEKKEAAEAARIAEEEERRKREAIQAALERASSAESAGSGSPTMRAGDDLGSDADDDAPAEDRADGTHEYECTQCGYIMFPAAGREFKFYGDDFKCPTCGCTKDKFVDNGVVEV